MIILRRDVEGQVSCPTNPLDMLLCPYQSCKYKMEGMLSEMTTEPCLGRSTESHVTLLPTAGARLN